MTLHAVDAAVTCYLAGVGWVVQLLVYPAFRTVGPTPSWPRFHAHHSRRITWVVAGPWAVQGVCVVLLLAREGGRPLVWLVAFLAATTVLTTLVGAVPQHERLSRYDDERVRMLLRWNMLRTLAWTAGAVASLLV